jgi:hypothetical protein
MMQMQTLRNQSEIEREKARTQPRLPRHGPVTMMSAILNGVTLMKTIGIFGEIANSVRMMYHSQGSTENVRDQHA